MKPARDELPARARATHERAQLAPSQTVRSRRQLVEQARTRLTSKSQALPRELSDVLNSGFGQRELEKSAATAGTRAGSRSLQHRMIERATFGWTLLEAAAIDQLGPRGYLERQLRPTEIDDFGLEAALRRALPSLAMTPFERLYRYYEEPVVPFLELATAKLLRAIYSPRQLFERMVDFWTDHFHTSIFADFGVFLKPSDDLDVIRRHALGRFPDLLRASAYSPAMLDYLTNDSNVKEHPNENYARELMELHTLGSNGGYSQIDVREVARAFTGWTFWNLETTGDLVGRFGRFRFDRRNHDTLPKSVLGQEIAAGGEADALRVLDILAHHDKTAEFLARKMLRFFWGYEPRDRTMAALAQVYRETGGDIPSLLRRIFTWYELAESTVKLKRPFHLVVSSMRALLASVEDVGPPLLSLLEAGHLPFTWGPPNGAPDSAGYWSGFLLPRLNYGSQVVARQNGFAPNADLFGTALPVVQAVSVLDRTLTGGNLGADTRLLLDQRLRAVSRGGPVSPALLMQAAGMVVSSPQFQIY